MSETELNKKTILFLLSDNDPVLARVIKNKFEKSAGWQSVIVSNYQDALATFDEKSPDAVMTEILLKDDSGKSGFDLIESIKQKKAGIPIIVFSELKQEEDKQKATASGATHYFVKSELSIQDLIEEITKIIKA